jgi:hypothetical protein
MIPQPGAYSLSYKQCNGHIVARTRQALEGFTRD